MLKKLKNKKWLYDFFIINIGLILMSIAYSIFVDPNNLIIGGVGGFFAHKYAFAGDVYQMVAYENGSTDVYIGSDEDLQTYTELGVKCIAFGKDVSSECTVKYYYRADLTQDQVEVSEVDETKPGIYYAVYSNTSKKYKSVTLIRNIIVLGEEG